MDFEQLTDSFIASRHTPTDAVDRLMNQQSEKDSKEPGMNTDTFDPDIHATDDSGKPKYNKDGSYRKKRGRKPGQKTTRQSASDDKSNFRYAGGAAANLTFTLGIMLGGDDWKPIIDKSRGIDEPEMMASAWAEYLEAQNIEDVPPGIALIIAMSIYASPRLMNSEQTKTRLQKFKGWITSKFSKKVNKKNES